MADPYFSDAALAALYDQFSPRERRDDFDFYLPLVMTARAVLDVGCGTGPMLREARAAGHDGRLCGLDPGAGMIEQARRHADVEWVQGDLESVAWNGEFDLIVMTGHTFQVLVDDEELRAGLAAICKALQSEGRFAFETRNPAAREWERWTDTHSGYVTDPAGNAVEMSTHLDAGFDGRTVTFTHTFSSPGWRQERVSRSTLRFLGAGDLSEFLSEAGLMVEQQFGDWDRSPLTDRSPEIVTIACRSL